MMMLEAHLKKDGMKHCPIDNSVNILGKKFSLNILRNMILLQQKRFSEFIESIKGINSKTLSTRLREMEEDDLIKRAVISSKPLHTEYTVTEKEKMIEPMLEILGVFYEIRAKSNI
jgi:DNA-binding HxlR family transcriptional regulator